MDPGFGFQPFGEKIAQVDRFRALAKGEGQIVRVFGRTLLVLEEPLVPYFKEEATGDTPNVSPLASQEHMR